MKSRDSMKYDTQMKKQNLTEPIMLANQAVAEMKKNGYVTTTCPKCNMTPKVILEDNRTVVKCKCGYIIDSEIYL